MLDCFQVSVQINNVGSHKLSGLREPFKSLEIVASQYIFVSRIKKGEKKVSLEENYKNKL